MKDFKARTEGINSAFLAGDQFELDNGAAPVDTLKPGTLLYMNTNGAFEILDGLTVTISNKHRVYYSNSWRDSVSPYGNSMVSAIPITKQFEYEITFEAGDEAIEPGADLAIGDLLCIRGGLYDEAGQGDYVIGSVKSGSATADLGGTITVVTWGGDYEIA